MFTGFPEETIRFFLDLKFHNQVSYYNERKEDFRRDVQEPFYAFIEELAPTMQGIDPLMEIRPYKCLARIRRDTRFTKDKTPYRDHLWLLFRRAAEPRDQAVTYWFELGVDSLEWGLGFWGENRPVMDTLRRRMAAQPQRYLDLIDSCDLPGHHLALGGSAFKRLAVPESIPERLRPWYLAKELYIPKLLVEQQWAFQPDIAQRVAEDFRAMAPLYRMLRGIYDETSSSEA